MSYAVLCLQTAYLKTHYPLYFFKALLNNNKGKSGMLNKYIIDARQFGIHVQPPDVNKSGVDFTVVDGKILFGLSAIKGIGESFAGEIIKQRDSSRFTSMEGFISGINPKKNQMVSLIKAGAIPCKDKKQALIKFLNMGFEYREYSPVSSIKPHKEMKEVWGIDCGIITDKDERLRLYNDKKRIAHEAAEKERYKRYVEDNAKYLDNQDFWEFEALSVFINDNPFARIYDFIEPFEDVEIGNVCVVAGIIANITKKKDRSKKQFAFLNIYSDAGNIEAICWHSQLKEFEDLITKGSQIAALCRKEGDGKIIIQAIRPYGEWLASRQKKISR
jgi:DNA polymerase-3 subunit alpha